MKPDLLAYRSVNNPTKYAECFFEYAGQEIPDEQSLQNRLLIKSRNVK
jgi:hypothetical protein